MKRRDLLKQIAEGAARLGGLTALGSLPLINSGCKGSTTPQTPPPPPPPAIDVSVKITFYNHTQGLLGEKTYNGKSNEGISLVINQLGFSGIDPLRIAVRKATGTLAMGDYRGFSKSGTMSISYPQQNEEWEAYLMNAGAGTDYQWIDQFIVDPGLGGWVTANRYHSWSRVDRNATGPDEPAILAFADANSALDHPWKSYGRFTQLESDGAFSVGYDIMDVPSRCTVYGGTLLVDPERCPTDEDKLKHFIEEIFQCFAFTPGIGPHDFIRTIYDSAGHLNDIGKDILAYVYVKDAKY